MNSFHYCDEISCNFAVQHWIRVVDIDDDDVDDFGLSNGMQALCDVHNEFDKRDSKKIRTNGSMKRKYKKKHTQHTHPYTWHLKARWNEISERNLNGFMPMNIRKYTITKISLSPCYSVLSFDFFSARIECTWFGWFPSVPFDFVNVFLFRLL